MQVTRAAFVTAAAAACGPIRIVNSSKFHGVNSIFSVVVGESGSGKSHPPKYFQKFMRQV